LFQQLNSGALEVIVQAVMRDIQAVMCNDQASKVQSLLGMSLETSGENALR